MTKAISLEQLAYYDTSVRPNQLKDIELEDTSLKITKRDGTNKTINLPSNSGGSYIHEIEKDYTTLYFTKQSLQFLGYSGFEDAELLKYRSSISTFNSKEVSDYYDNFTIGSYTPKFGMEIASSKDVDEDGNPKIAFDSYNRNLRVNVLEKKNAYYLENTSFYISKLISEMEGLDVLESGEGDILEIGLCVLDSDNDVRCWGIGYVSPSEWGDSVGESLRKIEIRDYNNTFSEKFDENCKLHINVSRSLRSSGNGFFGPAVAYPISNYPIMNLYWNTYESSITNLTTFENTYGEKEGRTIVTKDYSYQDLQDAILPIAIETIPVQVPSHKYEYSNYGTFVCNVYNYKLLLLDNSSDNSYFALLGQSIGDGVIIDKVLNNETYQLTFKAAVEGDETVCGTTTFKEVYPL